MLGGRASVEDDRVVQINSRSLKMQVAIHLSVIPEYAPEPHA